MANAGILSLLLSFSLILASRSSDLASDREALLQLKSELWRFLPWDPKNNTCAWMGIMCEGERVAALRLPGAGLTGEMPVGVFGNLTALHTISLRFNKLSGRIPEDVAQCRELRNIYLQDNELAGEIPAFLFGLKKLIRLNVGGNNFSGQISPDFNNLTRLRTLYLDRNQLEGVIPDLQIQNLTQFNVSNNHLNGSIPKSLRWMSKASFSGNSLCGAPVLAACPGEGASKKKKLSGGAIAGIAVGSAVLILLLLAILFVLCRKKTSRQTGSVEIAAARRTEGDSSVPKEKPSGEAMDRGIGAAPGLSVPDKGEATGGSGEDASAKKLVFFGNRGGRVFDLEDLLRASAEVLGKGTFGTAYKAVLETGTVVAVKRLKDVSIPEGEFKEKIEAVGSMDHENLVPLRAYYYNKDEKLLVYDFMPMGSLSALLHGNRGGGRTPLNWETRLGIAASSAAGVEYIHRQGPAISHGNIKSSNILLTRSYSARVSDFGLAHLAGAATSTPSRAAGYRAPEITDARRVSQKADVYSFGVLLLELLTGKAPTHSLLNEEGVDLPRWVQSVVREEWTAEVFDLELLRYQNIEEEMVQLLQLAIDCTAQYPDKRPTMSEVVRRIEELRRMHPEEDNEQQKQGEDAGIGSDPPNPLLY